MKKYVAMLYILMLSLATMVSYLAPTTKVDAQLNKSNEVIPEDAIRLRILANSNTEMDQNLKRAIRDRVKKEIDGWVVGLTSKEAAQEVISAHIEEIKDIAKNEIEKLGAKQTVSVELGKTEFPTKLYGDYLYPAGQYEALVIKLGEAEGDNWWCVLYPPLCFLDFSSGTAVKAEAKTKKQTETNATISYKNKKEASTKKKVKVQFLSKKMIDKIF
ncbi:MAG: stage sporulation protein [Bacillales bacterium]|jgi:stage II sporulation protein R|nr:stage sporulation protein [Bacillales bacterium]